MSGREWLTRGVEAVTFLFAAFGGFLEGVAPPEQASARFAVGFSSMLALIVLLYIAAASRVRPAARMRKLWLRTAAVAGGLAFITGLAYQWSLKDLTFPYPPEAVEAEYVRGLTHTPDAEEYLLQHPRTEPEDLVAEFGGLESMESVWTPRSITLAELLLTATYTALVLSLATAIFSLVEGVASSR